MLPCCGVGSVRCDWVKTPPYTIPHCEKQNLLSILRWLKEVTTVEWTLFAGTLLGSVRENGHIEHETDIDITVDKRDRAKLIREIEEHIPFSHFVFKADERHYVPDRVFFSETNLVHVDIWTHEKGEYFTKEVAYLKNGHRWYKVNNDILYPPSKCIYEGDYYNCPNKPVEWVRGRYGNDWSTPKPKYNLKPTYRDGDDIMFELIK
jgi:hypothetical protein